MRLLNVDSLKLELHHETIPYAILSHRWKDGGEILYEDIARDGLSPALRTRKKSGYNKIVATCNQAKAEGLSEEINSMYRYYQDAVICYAFLHSLSVDTVIESDDEFANHEWFTRGWTLQELIAPKEVTFFTDRGEDVVTQHESLWVCLGQRAGMSERLSAITGIDADVLSGVEHPRLASVAKRMSWAAKRETSRIEDTAYCLMGLFGINMPMLYGEGQNAFIRLQEEIMKDLSDETLFAWRDEGAIPAKRYGLLAPSPAAFKNSVNFHEYVDFEPRDPFFKTNRGIRITLPLQFIKDNIYAASLSCPSPLGSTGFAAIYLAKVDETDTANNSRQSNQYARVRGGRLFNVSKANERGTPTRIYVRQSVGQLPTPVYPEHIVQLHNGPAGNLQYTLHATMGHKSNMVLRLTTWSWIPENLKSAFEVKKKKDSLSAVVVFTRRDQSQLTILLGAKTDRGDVRAQVIDGTDENCTFAQWAHKFSQDPSQVTGEFVDLGPDKVRVDIVERIIIPRKYFVVGIYVEEKPPPMSAALDRLRGITQREIDQPLRETVSEDSDEPEPEEQDEPETKEQESKPEEIGKQARSGIKNLFRRRNGTTG
ncbi:hypothetical protein E8E14_002219 [Neopestalotiopsis sp. 37M]|nr:hypothetical protein E8E14_002219 [Neopestalotiopsis sp. 37M]